MPLSKLMQLLMTQTLDLDHVKRRTCDVMKKVIGKGKRSFQNNIKRAQTYLNRFDPFIWWCSELDLVKLANRMLQPHKCDPISLS